MSDMYEGDDLARIVAVHNSRKKVVRSLYDMHTAWDRRDHIICIMWGLAGMLVASGCILAAVVCWAGMRYWGWGPL